MLNGVIDDLQRPLVMLCYSKDFEAKRSDHFENNIKARLNGMNTYIGAKKFLFGDEPRYCDFKLYEAL